MGKKMKKARSGAKEKRVSTASSKTDSKPSILSSETADDAVSAPKERKLCAHLAKGVDIDKLSSKLRSAEPVRCEDCREGVIERRAIKGKGKHGKKKGGGSGGSVDSRSDYKAIWVCLDCGQFSCGGAGFPTTPQSHAVRHAKQNRHPLAAQLENPHLMWCFQCDKLIPVEKSEENREEKDGLHDIVKMIKGRPLEGFSVDVGNAWFGSGSGSGSVTKTEEIASSSLDGRSGYEVRGFVNLGNTCFFNSVLQNLLAMDKLRDYFLKLEVSVGPLNASLKKLFIETSPESGVRNLISPRSVLGNVCAKAPQFKGCQQHDSHELLRCLLDGLSSEESAAQKQTKSSQDGGVSQTLPPTFVDAIFGGQLSSTVTCLECGHSSIVHEPFLDLSLPVPTKKPPSKKVQPLYQAKKPKLPPKRSARIRSRVNRDANPTPAQSFSEPSTGGQSSCQGQSNDHAAENMMGSLADSTSLESVDPSTVADSKGSGLQIGSTTQESENKQSHENTAASHDDSTWMDYVELGAILDANDIASQINGVSEIQDIGDKDAVQNEALLGNNLVTSKEIPSICPEGTAPSSDDSIWLDYCEPDKFSEDHGMISQINNTYIVPVSENMGTVPNEVISLSGNQFCSTESNLLVDQSDNSWEDEAPLPVLGSEVLLLPYIDTPNNGELRGEGEASSLALGHEQDSLDFDGLGDLFDEPDVAAGPSVNPLSSDNTSGANEVSDVGFMVRNSSEADLDEVDVSDSRMSGDICLAYFTKSELLSKNEHAWQCENCSKALQEQRMRLKKKEQRPKSSLSINGGDNRNQNAALCLGEDRPVLIEVTNLSNGNVKRDAIDASDENLSLHNGRINCLQSHILESTQKTELNLVAPQLKHREIINACSVNETGVGCNAERCESKGSENEDEDEDEEMNSKCVKVKRDATKRILIDRAPPILTIHLKRFSQDRRGRLSKLNGHVVFKDTFDLRPYMDARCIDRDKYTYRLIGVVEHSGNMRGGHYVAHVRGGAKSKGNTDKDNRDFVWYYTSDGYVHQSSLDEVLRCDAYILFYEQF